MVKIINSVQIRSKLALEKAIFATIEKLRNGKIICASLENGYALIVDPSNEEAVAKMKLIKQLDDNYYFPLLIYSLDTIDGLVEGITPSARLLALEFWPGALNLQFTAKSGLPWTLGARQSPSELLVRSPSNKLLRGVVELFGPIIFSAANVSGESPARTIAKIPKEFMKVVDTCVDTGTCKSQENATTISCEGSIPRIIRAGAVPSFELKKALPTIIEC